MKTELQISSELSANIEKDDEYGIEDRNGYFINKHALAMLDYNLEQKRDAVNRVVESCASHREKLLSHISAYYPKEDSPVPGDSSPLFTIAIEAGTADEKMRQRPYCLGSRMWRTSLGRGCSPKSLSRTWSRMNLPDG